MANPICPTDCTSVLPPVSFNICAPEINLSEISKIYVAKAIAAPFVNWLSPAEWAARLAQTGGSDDSIRTLTVIGDKPAPTSTPRPISGNREVLTNKTHIINVTIDETSQINHDFVRALECGGIYRVWYETISGLIFGGNTGILAPIRLDMVLNRGTEEIATYSGVITWKDMFTEERGVSPIAGGGGVVVYNTILEFSAAVSDTENGVTGTVPAINAVKKFEFNGITTPIGTPASMEINVSATSAIVVDFTTDYSGLPFRYTHSTGTQYTGIFTNGSLDF